MPACVIVIDDSDQELAASTQLDIDSDASTIPATSQELRAMGREPPPKQACSNNAKPMGPVVKNVVENPNEVFLRICTFFRVLKACN